MRFRVLASTSRRHAFHQLTKDGVNTNTIRDPSTSQDEEDDGASHALTRTLLSKAVRLSSEPDERRTPEEPQGKDPSDRGEQNVEDDDARRGVDEGDGESEEDPAAAREKRAMRSVMARAAQEKTAYTTSLPTPAASTTTPTWF